MADAYGQCPPPASKAEELVGPIWQAWLSGISRAMTLAGVGGGASAYVSPAGRAAGVAYLNGGSPKQVLVTVTQTAAGDGATLTVAGVVVAQAKSPAAGAGLATLAAIVPKGASYQLALLGTGAVSSWMEL